MKLFQLIKEDQKLITMGLAAATVLLAGSLPLVSNSSYNKGIIKGYDDGVSEGIVQGRVGYVKGYDRGTVAVKAPEPKPEPTVAPVQEKVAFNCDVTNPDQKCAHSLTADQLRTEAEAKLFLDRAGNISGMCFGNYSQYYKKTCSYFM